jgi:hypothetical protein
MAILPILSIENGMANVMRGLERCVGVEPKQEFAHWRLTAPIRSSCAQTCSERGIVAGYLKNLIGI